MSRSSQYCELSYSPERTTEARHEAARVRDSSARSDFVVLREYRMITSFRMALALFGVFAVASFAPVAAQTPSPEGAKVYFINLKDGAEVDSPFLVQFGLSGGGYCSSRRGKTEHRPPPSADRCHVDGRSNEGTYSCRRQSQAFRRRPDGDHGDFAERPAHATTRARRLDAHPACAAGDVGADHNHGALGANRQQSTPPQCSPAIAFKLMSGDGGPSGLGADLWPTAPPALCTHFLTFRKKAVDFSTAFF